MFKFILAKASLSVPGGRKAKYKSLILTSFSPHSIMMLNTTLGHLMLGSKEDSKATANSINGSMKEPING
jgi:hypothetical protein